MSDDKRMPTGGWVYRDLPCTMCGGRGVVPISAPDTETLRQAVDDYVTLRHAVRWLPYTERRRAAAILKALTEAAQEDAKP